MNGDVHRPPGRYPYFEFVNAVVSAIEHGPVSSGFVVGSVVRVHAVMVDHIAPAVPGRSRLPNRPSRLSIGLVGQDSQEAPVAPTWIHGVVPHQRGRSRSAVAVEPVVDVGDVTIDGSSGLQAHRLAASIGIATIQPASIISAVVADAPVRDVAAQQLGRPTAAGSGQDGQDKSETVCLRHCMLLGSGFWLPQSGQRSAEPGPSGIQGEEPNFLGTALRTTSWCYGQATSGAKKVAWHVTVAGSRGERCRRLAPVLTKLLRLVGRTWSVSPTTSANLQASAGRYSASRQARAESCDPRCWMQRCGRRGNRSRW